MSVNKADVTPALAGGARGERPLRLALTLFIVGVYKARVTVGKPFRSGLEMAIIGTVSALAAYVVGPIFKVPTVP